MHEYRHLPAPDCRIVVAWWIMECPWGKITCTGKGDSLMGHTGYVYCSDFYPFNKNCDMFIISFV
jgi:hypothetical protein